MAKRVVILSSVGGHGHITTVKALHEILGDEYELTSIYPINDLSFFGHTRLEGFYNYFLRKNWTRAIGAISFTFARFFMWANRRQIRDYIGDHLDIIQPSLVISVIPFINRHGLVAAQRRGLNYLIITADNDLRHWLFDLDTIDLSRLEVTIGCDNRFTRPLLTSKGVPDEQIYTTGLPLRPKFIAKGKRQGRPAILMMLGGSGSQSAYEFTTRLLSLDLPADLYVATGRNRQLLSKLNRLPKATQCRLFPLDISADICEYMRNASLVIVKPGSLSTTEAMALEKPILIDHTHGVLVWEKMNSRIVLARGVGRAFYHTDELETLVPEMLGEEMQTQITKRYATIKPSQFAKAIPPLVKRLTG